MKILFKSKESNIIDAALKWQDSFKMNNDIKYFELSPYMAGGTPEYVEMKSPTGRAVSYIELTKNDIVNTNKIHTYAVFKHDMFGIILARKDD